MIKERRGTRCSLNIVFFSKILKYSELLPFSVLPRCQCVYTHQAGRTPALQQNWQKNHNILRKKHNFNEHPVGFIGGIKKWGPYTLLLCNMRIFGNSQKKTLHFTPLVHHFK